MITATSEDSGNITRNVSMFKQIPNPNLEPQDQIIEDFHGDMPNTELTRRYPTRNRRSPGAGCIKLLITFLITILYS